MSKIIFKILPATEWNEARQAGVFCGSGVDIADGFIHFSDAHQVRETAAKHFAGKNGLLLVAVDAGLLKDTLKYEVSRNGDLFAHLYDVLPVKDALWVKPLELGFNGAHIFPTLDET